MRERSDRTDTKCQKNDLPDVGDVIVLLEKTLYIEMTSKWFFIQNVGKTIKEMLKTNNCMRVGKILLPIQDKAEQEAKIMPKKETCAKCNRPITNNIKRIKGKAYHSKCREEILSEQYGK